MLLEEILAIYPVLCCNIFMKIRFSLLVFMLFVGGCFSGSDSRDGIASDPSTIREAYIVNTHSLSYFALNDDGTLLKEGGCPIKNEGEYWFSRLIDPSITAVIVMDPWVDMATEHLNDYFGTVLEWKILPLVNHAISAGYPVIVLTNDPTGRLYNAKIHPALDVLAAFGTLSIIYHEDMDRGVFADHLELQGITSLIYAGFSSNMCIIGRELGMVSMKNEGFRLFFIPEASAAVELPDTWDTGYIHESTTLMISQWLAEIIRYDDFMSMSY